MIKPTVGRVVLYTPAKTQDGRGDTKQPYAAIVVFVHDDKAVNLVVFDHLGRPHGRQNIQLLQDNDAPRDPSGEGFAEWMACQKQVAAGEIPAALHATSSVPGLPPHAATPPPALPETPAAQ